MKTISFWKRWTVGALFEFLQSFVYYAVIISCISLFWFILSVDFSPYQTNGLDADVFCAAGRAVRNHKNPYLVSELGSVLSWNYPPVYAYGFRIVCSHFSFQETYLYFYVAFFLLALDKWMGHKSWLYGLVLCLTGLYSFGWNLTTGNIGTAEFLIFSISFFLMWKNRATAAFFLLGILASIKMMAFLYFIPFLYFTEQKAQRGRSLLFGLFGFSIPFLLSAVVSFELMPWYVRQLFGMIPGQHSPIVERMDFTSPSMINLLIDPLSVTVPPTFRLILGVTLFVVAFTVIRRYFGNNAPDDDSRLILFSMYILITVLFLPRMKPYGFLPALLAVYLLTRDMAKWVWAVVLSLVSLLPMSFYYVYKYDAMNFIPFWASSALLNFISIYHQPIFMAFSFLFIVFMLKRQSHPFNFVADKNARKKTI